MSVREINQRWLATIGLSDEQIDEQIEMRADLLSRINTLKRNYGERPGWWRPFARRRWDRWMAGVEQRAIDNMRAEYEAPCA